MTTNKPGIKIYEPSEKGVTAMRKASFRNTGLNRYVRLSDYEALQAECERLRKDADRIDWLADPNNSIGNVQLPMVIVRQHLHSLRDAIDAAMEPSK